MDIRTKLVFALVAVALGSMLALGTFSYHAARGLLAELALRQLEAVAESKKSDLEKVVVAWQDRVHLITSRTQLRISVLEFSRTQSPAEQERVRRILDDARQSVRAVRSISVFDATGRPVASTAGEPSELEGLGDSALPGTDGPVRYDGVSQDADGNLLVTFVAPMRLRGSRIGTVRAVLSAGEVLDLTGDYTGLGESGETLVARRDETGDALILNPLRHGTASPMRQIDGSRLDDPVVRAVRGHEATYRKGALDYRGEEVWAATRYLPELGWGLVVKVDAAEELQPVRNLRDTMVKLALSLSAFAIVLGTVLGLYFAKPIRELAEVAFRIRQGDLDLRAQVGSEDEVGQLAATFNAMTEELIATNRELQRRIEGRGKSSDRPDTG